jgi:iron complex outermembrane receptor protein
MYPSIGESTVITSLKNIGVFMRIVAVAAVLGLTMVGLTFADNAAAAMRKPTSIPAQGLGPALQAFAKDRNLYLIFATQDVTDLRTQGAIGEFTPEETLKALLNGSGLTFKFIDDTTVTILPATRATAPKTKQTSQDGDELRAEEHASIRLAQSGVSQQISQPSTSEPNDSRSALAEILVTAEKRSERLQDAPVPVTAISGQSLTDSNQLRLQDYFSSVPGLNVTPADFGAPQLTIRGITTGGNTNPSVGIVVDDVPYGSSTVLGGGFLAPDFDPSDLARVEVLRGPQGTLYGANSLGGLVKYVTIDPSTDRVSGLLEAGTSRVFNGEEYGYNYRGSINVPLSDTVAIRASGFARRDPGYIDNVLTGQSGINRTTVDGGRLSALWRPSQDFSMKVSALLQNSNADGSSYVQSGIGNLKQNTIRNSGYFDSRIQSYSATLTGKIGVVDLTSLSGYNVNKVNNAFDFTPLAGPLSNALFGVGGAPEINYNKTKKFTQEVRLTAPLGDRVDWLFGVFYAHENNASVQQILAADPQTGASVGSLLNVNFPTTYSEYAAFTDFTFHVTDRFSLQIGGRESENKQTYSTTWTGPYVPIVLQVPSPLIPPPADTKANAFTYLVTPQFKVSPDLMVYARLASGYRPGGPNVNSTLNQLPTFGPDKTQNYEIGVKGDALDHILSFDASLYYIDWKDIQLQLIDPVAHVAVYVNASRAKSQGLELSATARPLKGLTVAAWISLNDAVLTEPFPATSQEYGASGDRLPDSSRFSGNLSVDQTFPIVDRLNGFVGAATSYVGDRLGVFTVRAAPQRQDLAAYVKTDLRAGVKLDTWTGNLFVNNIADRRGLLTGGLGTAITENYYYIQPRTIGLFVSKVF